MNILTILAKHWHVLGKTPSGIQQTPLLRQMTEKREKSTPRKGAQGFREIAGTENEAGSIDGVRRHASILQIDLAAVEIVIRKPETDGEVEGQINRLKTPARVM